MELETLVCNFRKAIEAAQANYEPGEFFRKFPTGQCGHTSYGDVESQRGLMMPKLIASDVNNQSIHDKPGVT